MNWVSLLVDLISALIRSAPGVVESIKRIVESGELSEEEKAVQLELLKKELADVNAKVQAVKTK